MKKIHILYIFFMVLFYIPISAYIILAIYSKEHVYKRHFKANLERIGYNIEMAETEHDTVLSFKFIKNDKSDSICNLRIHNENWDVVSFVITKNVDTIFIGKNIQFCKRPDFCNTSNNSSHEPNVAIGEIPQRCELISQYESSNLKNRQTQDGAIILDNQETHIITIVHNVERCNIYTVIDKTPKDTIEYELKECM